jgi:hypothetical protein
MQGLEEMVKSLPSPSKMAYVPKYEKVGVKHNASDRFHIWEWNYPEPCYQKPGRSIWAQGVARVKF